MDEFSRVRLDRLKALDCAATSPEDALRLAQRHLEECGSSGKLIVVIENEEGGTTKIFSQATLSDAVFLLESAKLALMSRKD